MGSCKILSFYRFIPIEEATLPSLKNQLLEIGNRLSLRGLILLAPEGYNATIAAEKAKLDEFFAEFQSRIETKDIILKESSSNSNPFRRFKIDVRPEIITFGGMKAVDENSPSFLSPKQWHQTLTNPDEDYVLIDTRNVYETKVGKFRDAVDPQIKHFTEFPKAVEELDIPKDKKILLYCTGGVRCEKAIAEMYGQGYSNVFQLRGGILKYLEEYPHQEYEGECFVFDHRVAVGQELAPSSQYRLCPHCGDPGSKAITCDNCGMHAVICGDCDGSSQIAACSKNCRYHLTHKSLTP